MAISINNSHSLYSRTKMLIVVDPTSGQLVDLARGGVTFTMDSGATSVTDTIGKVIRVGGADASSSQGFSFSPAYSPGGSQVAGFAGTFFAVINKHTGDDAGLASYKNNNPFTPNVIVNFPLPGIAGPSNGRKVVITPTNVDTYNASQASSTTFYNDGLRHSVATTASNPAGGWSSLAGKLFIDGADTGVTSTGTAGDVTFSAFNKLNNSLFKGDFVLMAYFDKVLTPTEISDLHASIGNNGVFGLVSGTAVAAAPAGTVTVGTVTPSTTSAVVNYTYSNTDQTGFEYRINGGAATTLGASPATISGLTASTSYALEVRAVNATGSGAWSTPATNFTTSAGADTTLPTLAGSITTSSVTSGGYTASWPIASDNVAVTGYEYSINSGAWTSTGTATSVNVTGRTAGTTDTFQVRAYDAAGNRSTPALSVNVTLAASADVTNPVLAGSITSSAITSSSYTISWPTGSDNVAVTGYEYNINSTGWISVGNSTSANISGRTAGTTDSVQVRAYDAAGNRSTPALSANITLATVVVGSVSISDPLKNNAGNLLTSLSGIKATVLRSSDFVSVCTVTGLTTDGSGVLSAVSNANIVSGTAYHVVIKTSSGGVGVTGPINAS